MKLSRLREIVREELQKIVAERRSIVPSREPPRKMTKPQVSKRTSSGDAAISKTKDKARAARLKKGGNDDADIFWAAMTNNALKEQVAAKNSVLGEAVIRLRDISNVFTLPSVNEVLPSQYPEEGNSMEGDDEVGQQEHAKAKLMRLHKQTAALYNMLGDVDEAEEWVTQKIADAAECINSVFNHIEYEKNKPSSLGNGEGTPADSGVTPNAGAKY